MIDERPYQTQGLREQSSPNFLSDVEGSSAVLSCDPHIRCGMPAHRMKAGYANFRQFTPKIGYHSNIP